MKTFPKPKRNANEATYKISNESLPAIVTGLNARPRDRILAVGGSGDQALALLEFAGQVVAVDNSPAQVGLIRKRVGILRGGHYNEFFCHHPDETEDTKTARNQYFAQNGRLQRIASRLDRLKILGPRDIFEIIADSPQGAFNKFYLSNVLGYSFPKSAYQLAGNIASQLPLCGLVYLAQNKDKSWQVFLEEQGLVINERLTIAAQEREESYRKGLNGTEKTIFSELSWIPVVLEKVAKD